MTRDARDALLRTFLLERGVLERGVARRVGCRATAADLIQDLFLRLWQRPPSDAHAAGRYLQTSARNLTTDYLRTRAYRTEDGGPATDIAEPSPAPDDALAARRRVEVVEAALQALPERTRRTFLLNRVHGRTCPDIARILDVSLATVERDVARALMACRAALGRV